MILWWEDGVGWGQVDGFESEMLNFVVFCEYYDFWSIDLKKLLDKLHMPCIFLSPTFNFHFLVVKLPHLHPCRFIHSLIHYINIYFAYLYYFSGILIEAVDMKINKTWSL